MDTLVTALVNALTQRHWLLVGAVLVSGLVWALRTWGGSLVPWVRTDRGGATLALVGGFVGVWVTALAAGQGASWYLVAHGLEAAVAAAGGYSVLKKLVFPSDA